MTESLMKKIIGFISFLLCICILLVAFASCGSSTDPSNEASGDPQKQDTESLTESATETEARLQPLVPDVKYDRDFNFLHWDVGNAGVGGGWVVWEEIFADKMVGDTLNDAIYNRNTYINEKYGVNITNTYRDIGAVNETVKLMHTSGSQDYDAILQRSVQVGGILTGGFLHNLQDMTYMNLSSPWWNQDSISSLAMGKLNQFIASDITVLDKSATACVQFNAKVADEHKAAVGDLYEQVDNGEWTFERFVEICDEVGADLDNDGKRNGEGDLVAFYCGDDPIHFLYNAAGLRFMDHDSDGYFEYKFNSQVSFDTLETIFTDLMYADFFHNNVVDGSYGVDKFRNNEQLFRMGFVKNASQLRDMESDYGILPIPMFNNDQDEFYSEVSPHHDSIMFICNSIVDTSFVSAVLESLACESYYTVSPVFYDVIITGRSVRDEQSKRMLELIFSTRVYDAGLIFDMNSFGGVVLRHTKTHTTGFASLWEKNQSAVEAKLDEFNEMIEKMNS